MSEPLVNSGLKRIFYVQYSNPALYPPLEHSAQLLAQHGCNVRMLGVETGAQNLMFAAHPNIELQVLPRVPSGWRQRANYANYFLRALQIARSWRPDWIYASDVLSAPVALALHSLLHVPVLYHEHGAPDEPNSIFVKFCMAARQRLFPRAEICVVPNARRAERLRAEFQIPSEKIFTVWNCPLRAEAAASPITRDDTILRVLYHGSVVPARLPCTVIDALSRLPDNVCLTVLGYETIGHPNYFAELRSRAEELGITSRVNILGSVPTRAGLLLEARHCNVGLALMPRTTESWNEQTMAGASNKPFDYMACGLPFLVSNLPDWNAMFVDNGFARACHPDDAASIAESLQWFLDHPAARKTMGEAGRRKIQAEWNYETQFAPVLGKLLNG